MRDCQNAASEVLDADALLDQAEDILLAPLDQKRAQAEVEQAARQVAGRHRTWCRWPLADVVTALLSSLRMIRRIAEIYGGRSGFFSSWGLTRAVFTHLVATGAVAVGDDLLEPILGGSVLSKALPPVWRRAGERCADRARVGLAAMEVCRPMPFLSSRQTLHAQSHSECAHRSCVAGQQAPNNT